MHSKRAGFRRVQQLANEKAMKNTRTRKPTRAQLKRAQKQYTALRAQLAALRQDNVPVNVAVIRFNGSVIRDGHTFIVTMPTPKRTLVYTSGRKDLLVPHAYRDEPTPRQLERDAYLERRYKRTVKRMVNLGLIERLPRLNDAIVPEINARTFRLDQPLDAEEHAFAKAEHNRTRTRFPSQSEIAFDAQQANAISGWPLGTPAPETVCIDLTLSQYFDQRDMRMRQWRERNGIPADGWPEVAIVTS